MDFIWNDGGRAACGFVGLAGDCVTRAIAIGSGCNYRTVYDELGAQANTSPRNGLQSHVAADYLASRGWRCVQGENGSFVPQLLPKGIAIVHLARPSGRSGHFTTVIDHVVYDTWNPAEDQYKVIAYWLPPASSETSFPGRVQALVVSPHHGSSHEHELTQTQFDKILRRLRALDNTASNQASTEGEKRNALRMMQSLLMQHNLTRDDISPQDNSDHVQFTRMSCVLNGRRACNWEYSLADYVCTHVFPLVQFYSNKRGNRTAFQFYGPRIDVRNCVELFRELVLTIASSAALKFGGYSRGSGASYAEGYVAGLPKHESSPQFARPEMVRQPGDAVASRSELFQNRALAVHQRACRWLRDECGVSLTTTKSSARYLDDPMARSLGRQHGATHEIKSAQQPKRLS